MYEEVLCFYHYESQNVICSNENLYDITVDSETKQLFIDKRLMLHWAWIESDIEC